MVKLQLPLKNKIKTDQLLFFFSVPKILSVHVDSHLCKDFFFVKKVKKKKKKSFHRFSIPRKTFYRHPFFQYHLNKEPPDLYFCALKFQCFLLILFPKFYIHINSLFYRKNLLRFFERKRQKYTSEQNLKAYCLPDNNFEILLKDV